MASEMDRSWFDPETSTFGDRIAGAREAAGMSQFELSRRLGVKMASLVAWEDDRTEPRANKLQMLAGLLNVSLIWLLNGEGAGGVSGDEATGGQAASGEGAPVEVADAGTDPGGAADMQALLGELREVRSQALRLSDRVGAIEARLRDTLDGMDQNV